MYLFKAQPFIFENQQNLIKAYLCFPYVSQTVVFFFFCFVFFVCLFFNKLKVCGNPAGSKSTGSIFPIAFAHLMSLCHILAILVIFQSFSLLSYWWSVISYLWYYHCHCCRASQHMPLSGNELDPQMMSMFWLLSLPLFRPLGSLRHNKIEMRPVHSLTVTLSVQVKGRLTQLSESKAGKD